MKEETREPAEEPALAKKSVVMATKKYRVKAAALRKHPQLVSLHRPSGKTVSLTDKEVKREVPGDKGAPGYTVVAPPATQEELKYFFEVEKHPFIEEYEG